MLWFCAHLHLYTYIIHTLSDDKVTVVTEREMIAHFLLLGVLITWPCINGHCLKMITPVYVAAEIQTLPPSVVYMQRRF